MVHFLIEAGADVNKKQSSGLTPLHIASENDIDNFDMVLYLLKAGAAMSTEGALRDQLRFISLFKRIIIMWHVA